MRAIGNLPEEFTERNFALYSYVAENGKKNPMYNITRDGMTMLIMGFTGAKAMKFKMLFIEAFNARWKEDY